MINSNTPGLDPETRRQLKEIESDGRMTKLESHIGELEKQLVHASESFGDLISRIAHLEALVKDLMKPIATPKPPKNPLTV